jgi:hypothetical protein
VTTFNSKFYTGVRNFAQPDDSDLDPVPVDVDFPTAAPVANDLFLLTKLPIGVGLQDYEFHFPDIDSGGAPAWAFSFGIMNAGLTDLATVFASGVTAGQSNALVRNLNTDCSQFATTAERVLGIKVTTAAATWAGAGKTGQVVIRLRG